jgi:hypothetical protein
MAMTIGTAPEFVAGRQDDALAVPAIEGTA